MTIKSVAPVFISDRYTLAFKFCYLVFLLSKPEYLLSVSY